MREKGICAKERECIVFIYEICRKTLAGTEGDRYKENERKRLKKRENELESK